MNETLTLERKTTVLLVTGTRKDPETQKITPVTHEVSLPGGMRLGDVLAGVGGERARPVFVQTNFKHADPNSIEATPVIGKEYEIMAYTGSWETDGHVDARAYEVSGVRQEKLDAFVDKYK